MQGHILMHPYLQEAKRKTQGRTRPGLAVWVILLPASCTCHVLKAGGGVKIHCPIDGVIWVLDSLPSFRLRFGHNAAYFASTTQEHLNRKDAKDEGLITNQRSTTHQNPSDDGLDFFLGHILVQNLHVHKVHIFTSFFVITGIFKFMDSHKEKSGAPRRILIRRRKNPRK